MLNPDQLQMYREQGFAAPVDVYTADEIALIRDEIRAAEARHGKKMLGQGRNNAHFVLPVLDRIAHEPRILDAVEQLIGPDVLVGGTTLFVKEPATEGFVSWHQDARYIGLEPHNWVTAWLAVDDVDEGNGCMRMLPGSHHAPLADHVDTFDDNNLLTRGQTVPDVDEELTVPIIMKAGQLSFHHPRIVHGSRPNFSPRRRTGFAIQAYIGGNVEQAHGRIWVQQARGQRCGDHGIAGRVSGEMLPEELAFRDMTNDELAKIFYAGAEKTGQY
jgi:non-heme Fe2+,alpha-ketoglutarate-dependent halogenase